MPETAMIGFPSDQTVGRLAADAQPLGLRHSGLDSQGHALCTLVLYGENVSEVAVISLRPQVSACSGLDKLTSNANATTRLADTALKYVAHTEFSADLLNINSTSFVDEARVPGDYEERV